MMLPHMGMLLYNSIDDVSLWKVTISVSVLISVSGIWIILKRKRSRSFWWKQNQEENKETEIEEQRNKTGKIKRAHGNWMEPDMHMWSNKSKDKETGNR